MTIVELVAMLAVLQYVFFRFKTETIIDTESFERMYRVQVNTMENMVAFLPALFVAGKYGSPVLVGPIGLVYIIGRFVYWRAYVNNPATRTTGFLTSIIPTFVLIVISLIGIILTFLSGS